MTTGRGLYYAAQVEIPARKYTETVTTAQETDAQAENGENTEGMSRETVTRTPGAAGHRGCEPVPVCH